MAKNTAATLLTGHVSSSLHRMQKNSGQGHLQNKKKKALKSKAASQIQAERVDSIPVGDVESDDDDDGDGMAADEVGTNDDDADVSALSGAQQHNVEVAAQRLAGHDSDEERKMVIDANMNDDDQATAGASEEDFMVDDEDDYGDLENVSDSDDEQSGVKGILRAAEQDLVAEFETGEASRIAYHMSADLVMMDLRGAEQDAYGLGLLDTPAELNDDFDSTVNMNEDPFQGHSLLGDEYQHMWGTAESALWRMPETVRESSDPTSATQKRVRFEEVREPTESASPTDSEDEDPNDAFPDLLAHDERGVANSGLLGMMVDDVFMPHDLDDTDSVYDFDGDDEKLAFQIDEESDSDSDESSYHSDDSGDTTDEETMEESVAKEPERKKSTMKAMEMAQKELREEIQQGKRVSPASTPSAKTPRKVVLVSRPATPKSGKGPQMGLFEADPTRAAITTDVDGGKLKIEPPTKPTEKDREYWERARSAIEIREGSPRNSFQIVHSVSSDSIPSRPFTAKSTLGSMFNGNLDILRNNDTNGIAEELFPQVMSRPQSSYSSFDGTDATDTDLNIDMTIQDLVNISDSDSDVMMQSSAITSPTTPSAFPTLDRDSSDLFEHFTQNPAAIGAFRQNQNLTKHLSSQASHPAQRASTHEYNALQKGRRGAANTPITPARKKRASQDLSSLGNSSGIRKSFNSSLATSNRRRSRGNSLAHADLYQTIGRNPFD